MTSEMQPGRETKVNERDKEISAPLLALFTRTDHLTIGRVCGSEDHGVWRISALPGDTVLARVAVSCLVKPQLDDLVQLYQTARGCWVLAILERSGDAEAVVLDFGAASLRIQAHGMLLQASDRLDFEAVQIASRADVVTEVAAERYTHVRGTELHSCRKHVRPYGGAFGDACTKRCGVGRSVD